MYFRRKHIFLILCLALMVVISGLIQNTLITANKADRTINDIVPIEDITSGFTGQIVVDLNQYGATPDESLEQKIADAKAVNNDVTGWITIEDFGIDYPVLYSTDNKAYLRTSIYGGHSVAGCIYLDANYGNVHSPMKLIHGHNMANDTMFGKIPDLLFWESLDEAPEIVYCDELGVKVFRIFSVFSVDAQKESVIVNDQLSLEELYDLQQEYLKRSWVPTTQAVQSSEMLMLNTCWYGLTGKEHFLHCIVVASRIK